MSNFKSSIRREKMVHKDTRWDRIRKRNSIESTNALKTDAVKRLIEKDFIGKQNQRLLNGEGAGLSLNPSIIMDIRHEMVSSSRI